MPVLDNLVRALSQASHEFRAGLDATLRGFQAALAGVGVTCVAEALGTQSVAGADDDTVVAETRRGFLLDDELRLAQVVIVKQN